MRGKNTCDKDYKRRKIERKHKRKVGEEEALHGALASPQVISALSISMYPPDLLS